MGYDPVIATLQAVRTFYVVLTNSKWVFCKYGSITLMDHICRIKSHLAKQEMHKSLTKHFNINCLSTVSGVTMGMTFTDIENKSAKRLIGIAAVLFCIFLLPIF